MPRRLECESLHRDLQHVPFVQSSNLNIGSSRDDTCMPIRKAPEPRRLPSSFRPESFVPIQFLVRIDAVPLLRIPLNSR